MVFLHQYGEDKLKAAGEDAGIRQLHADFFSNYLQEREADIKGKRQLDALREIDAELEKHPCCLAICH